MLSLLSTSINCPVSRGQIIRDFQSKRRVNPYSVRIRQPPSNFTQPLVDSNAALETAILKINLTRLIRIAYNIYMAFTKPFNRTSMELKPSNSTRIALIKGPTFNRTSMELKPSEVGEVDCANGQSF